MRKHFIDNIRWLIVLVLIPYHAAMAWNVWDEPNYIMLGGNRAISSIVAAFSPFFMPILFMLAGISTRYYLKKRTMKQYIAERTKRLIVPLIFGVAVLMPAMTCIADIHNCEYSGGYFAHYAVFFTKFTDLTGSDGGFSLGQFWFLLYLFVISLISCGVIKLFRKKENDSQKPLPYPVLFLLGLPLPLLSELLSVSGKSIAEYTYIFLIGYYIFSKDEVISTLEKYRVFSLCTGIAACIADVYMFIWSGKEFPFLNTAAKYVTEWSMILALMGMGKKHFDFSNRLTRYMSARSFPFFSFHFVWVVLFQHIWTDALKNNTVLMFLAPVTAAYICTFACCGVCLNLPVLCYLTGTKYTAKE